MWSSILDANQSGLYALAAVSPWLILLTVLVSVVTLYTQRNTKQPENAPPLVPSRIPFVGSLVSFGMNPIKFLQAQREKYGDIFTFVMWGRRMTYALGPEGNNLVFNARLDQANAEDAYRTLTVPVFGREVVYDVENPVFMEQKRFVKGAMSAQNLRSYVSIIEQETTNYFKRWKGKSGESEIFTALSELTIMTASACLMGPEIRSQLDERVAKLYHDLDQGFQPINFLFKWLPIPSYWRRDRANAEMRSLFLRIMKQRRADKTASYGDVLQTLMESKYKDGKPMTENQVAHLMIALLMAGQHTSSTTSTWSMLYLAAHPEIQSALLDELVAAFGKHPTRVNAAGIMSLQATPLLDSVVREVLRLRPPIVVIMRKARAPIVHPTTGYVVPTGDYICTSPAITQLDEREFKNASAFDPYRWMSNGRAVGEAELKEGEGEDFGFGIMKKSGSSPYLPFGAGRHRCIGESFAYVQLKTIIAILVLEFKFRLTERGFPKRDFTSMIVMPARPAMIHWERRN